MILRYFISFHRWWIFLLTISLGLATSAVQSYGASIVYDLGSSWSDQMNPNGVWAYNAGTNRLPHVASWETGGQVFSGDQSGWAPNEGPFNDLPVWFKSSAPPRFAADWQSGDIVTHSIDDVNGGGRGEANVTWTSPLDGIADISGAVWMGRDITRGNQWRLYHNNTVISRGDVYSGDLYNRAKPFLFSLGSGGTNAISGIPIKKGDVMKLEIVRTSFAGDFVGVKFAIRLTVPQPSLSVAVYAGIAIEGTVGKQYRLEYLNAVAGEEQWVPITSFVLPESPFLYMDLSSTNSPKRFYRVVELP